MSASIRVPLRPKQNSPESRFEFIRHAACLGIPCLDLDETELAKEVRQVEVIAVGYNQPRDH
ncbi:MAG: hypothetical protein D6793_08115 [Thermoflexia bacterium]|nr:MAG: hypothetical protein D6793_08115 [Thermoflexia bacterium]